MNANVTSMAPDHRLLTEAGARAIYERLRALQHGDGRLVVGIWAGWTGYVRWARNRVTLASDERRIEVNVLRQGESGFGMTQTNQVDDASLTAAVRAAEHKMVMGNGRGEDPYPGLRFMPPLLPFPDTSIWSDATYDVTPEQRGALVRALTREAEARQLLSAGFIHMRVGETVTYGPPVHSTGQMAGRAEPPVGRQGERRARESGYARHTEAQCSMTVRHPHGVGSGWAGLSGYDWSVIDAAKLAQRALDKCVQSLNPVAIEPGRYTVILEPQAVATFADAFVGSMGARKMHERPSPDVFSSDIDPVSGLRLTKLGTKIVDERISITHDPMDGRLGVVPELGLTPVTWVDRGVLRSLGYGRDVSLDDYALAKLNDNLPVVATGSYQMAGGDTSPEEMVATTKRGLLVSRFSDVTAILEGKLSMLMTGVTRDGLWLIEDGKISKSVKNMRFTDSPLFVFNNVEQLGAPVPVFHPSPREDGLRPVIVPAIKARDFAFTATIDAV